jgi:hypothetical protein
MLLGHLVPEHADTNERREGTNVIHNTILFVDPLPASKYSFLPYKNNLTINSVHETSSKFALETSYIHS